MGSRYKSEAVMMVECLRYVLTECVPSTARGNSPAASVVGVRPEKVAHRSLKTFKHQSDASFNFNILTS